MSDETKQTLIAWMFGFLILASFAACEAVTNYSREQTRRACMQAGADPEKCR